MAVSKMKLFNIIGHIDSLDATLFACGDTGVSQPDNALTFFSDTSDFTALNENNPYSEPLSRLESSVSRIGGQLKTLRCDMRSDPDKRELLDYVDNFAAKVEEMTKMRGRLAVRAEELSKDCEQFEHFIGLGIDLDAILKCKMIKVRFGRLPRDSYEKLAMYDKNPYVLFFPGVADKEYYWGVYFAPLELADEVDRVFSGLYFERLRIPSAEGTPEQIVAGLKTQKVETEQEFKKLDKQINDFWLTERDNCLRVYTKLKQLNYYFSARRYAAKYNDKFILTGWVPARDEKKFKISLDAVDAIEYTLEDADSDKHHTPPVMLRNPLLFKPFEFFVDMFGLPRYNEIDPTLFVGITYTLLFGIMFGDLGQGLVLAVAGWLMWKFKQMSIGRILIPCGISSAVFGTVFGSVFGFEHVLDPLYKRLFGLSEKPVEVMNPSMTGNILLASVGVGLALIVTAMVLNIYSSLKRRDYQNGIFGPNGVAGLIFYSSLVLGAAGMIRGAFKMNIAYVLLLIALPLLLIYLREPLSKLLKRESDWQPESWGEYCMQNAFELFEMMLAYLSNTVSFLRVGAFVLVHAGMMMAVFTLASLTSGFAYALIVISGNIIVTAMEALLVAIQVMRLEFYEMFSRYYNGDGRPYNPLKSVSDEKVFSDRA